MLKFIKNQGGSLLLDLVVSLGIIALISTISLPYFKKYQTNLKLNGAARELTTDLRYAQQLTIGQQAVHLLEMDLATDSYQILRSGVATTTVKAVTLDPAVSFQQITGLDSNRVVFNSYGGVSQAGQIILVNTNGITATINIKPSGYVELLQ